jgi:hypothetical protein
MALEHQGPLGWIYAENNRWAYVGAIFVGLNALGSNNNKVTTAEECTQESAPPPDNCHAANVDYAARNAADIAWLEQSFQVARDRGALGVMVIIQADPSCDLPETTVNERTQA